MLVPAVFAVFFFKFHCPFRNIHIDNENEFEECQNNLRNF